LKWSLEQFPQARWLFVMSGDSVPTKRPRAFIEGPLSGASVLGFHSEANKGNKIAELGGLQFYEHLQSKVLSKEHCAHVFNEVLGPNLQK
jgi:hypothetical protein